MKKKQKIQKPVQEPWQAKEWQMLLLSLIPFLIYFGYSFIPQELYQHDEVGHYFSMRGFWDNPNSILGNWPKTGYKLVYVIPSLFGPGFLVFFNCVLAALCCFLCFKVSMQTGSRNSLLAFCLLALQPFMIQLSFRNYPEILTAVFLLLAAYFHFRHRYIISSLFVSYTMIIRQEMAPVLIAYALYFVMKKKWLPVLSLLVFPLLYNLWGALAFHDPLYLFTSTLSLGRKFADTYPRHGFWHYALMSITIFGPVCVTLMAAYTGELFLFRKSKVRDAISRNQFTSDDVKLKHAGYFLLAVVLLFTGIHSLFNLKLIKIGTSPGGVLRYMMVVSPFIAILGGIAADWLAHLKDRLRLFPFFAVLLIVVGVFMSRQHNNTVFLDQTDLKPFIFTALTVLILLLPLSAGKRAAALVGASVIFNLLAIRPYPISPENETMKKVALWAKERHVEEHRILVNHSLFFYHLGMLKSDVKEGSETITKESVEKAPAGTIIVWDSHYSFRPTLKENQMNYDYYLKDKERFRLLMQFISRDKRFGVFIFEKL